MRFRLVLFVLWIGLCLAAPVLAQLDCPSLAEAGISTLAANCTDLEANTVCYGSDLVEATFAEDTPPTTFDIPGDRAFLSQFTAVHTLRGDLEKLQWGIAVVEASVPLDDSDSSVRLMAMGDTTLNYARTPLMLDDTATAQLFHFATAVEAPTCAETPSLLAVQAPNDAQFALNSASFRFVAAGIGIFQQQSANGLSLVVESGQIEVSVDESNVQIVQAGQTIAAITDNSGTILLWSAPREVTDEETVSAGIAVEALFRMAGETVTAAPIPTEAPPATVIEPTAEPVVEEATMACGTNVVHVVQRGETIFRIAMRYGTTVDAIALANNLANPRLIHSGLQLVIPCADSVVVVPPVVVPPVSNPPAVSGTCGTYVVQTGDTLYGIALSFGTTVEVLAAANGITDINAIAIGQTLVIPCAGATVDCTPFIQAGLPCP
jgi:LysM repeat protein